MHSEMKGKNQNFSNLLIIILLNFSTPGESRRAHLYASVCVHNSLQLQWSQVRCMYVCGCELFWHHHCPYNALILTGPLLFQQSVGPRFPCVRNHPPTCCSRHGAKTVKLYTESLWAAGRALMKDSVTAERITNARLRDTAHTCTCTKPTLKVGKRMHTLSRHRLTQPRLKGRWEMECGGGWRDG